MIRKSSAPGSLARPSFARSGDRWPGGMGHLSSVGSPYGMRYPYSARANRLAIDVASLLVVAGGSVTLLSSPRP